MCRLWIAAIFLSVCSFHADVQSQDRGAGVLSADFSGESSSSDARPSSETEGTTEEAITNRQLLERIEKLEERIAELEARAESQRDAPFPSPEPNRPERRPGPPNLPDPLRPRPPRGQAPEGRPTPRQPLRRLPLERDVPDSWQRFEFNGQSFYIIPVDEAAPKSDKRR